MLVDDQAVGDLDLKLLLKLIYSSSFSHEEGMLLPKATRLRLLVLASAFEIDDCVNDCLESLGKRLMLEEAITLCEDVPEEVRGHEAMKELLLQAVKTLTAGIDKLKGEVGEEEADEEEGDEEQNAKLPKLQAAGDALAKRNRGKTGLLNL